ncbi:MAG: hypothetical protein GQ527_08855 [Bacteroidales bacterium]|nr:hypothetical protein [Bacteroidales bacterium]
MLKQKEEDFQELEEDFNELISQIFNQEIPFTQTSNIKDCSYFIYKNICSRNE